jgi:hypothetical protein
MDRQGWSGWCEILVEVTVYLCGLIGLAFLQAVLVFTLIVLGMNYRPAWGQHAGHAQHHASYQSWVNRNGHGCCNDTDCREIGAGEEREQHGALEVLIHGVGAARGQVAWCPVLSHHYLKAGNVPNASVSHVCVTGYYGATTPCTQFICYQPQPRM